MAPYSLIGSHVVGPGSLVLALHSLSAIRYAKGKWRHPPPVLCPYLVWLKPRCGVDKENFPYARFGRFPFDLFKLDFPSSCPFRTHIGKVASFPHYYTHWLALALLSLALLGPLDVKAGRYVRLGGPKRTFCKPPSLTKVQPVGKFIARSFAGSCALYSQNFGMA